MEVAGAGAAPRPWAQQGRRRAPGQGARRRQQADRDILGPVARTRCRTSYLIPARSESCFPVDKGVYLFVPSSVSGVVGSVREDVLGEYPGSRVLSLVFFFFVMLPPRSSQTGKLNHESVEARKSGEEGSVRHSQLQTRQRRSDRWVIHPFKYLPGNLVVGCN